MFGVTVTFLILSSVSWSDPPPGYYDPASGLTGPALQEALHDIIDDHTNISYDAIWGAFYTTDDRNGNEVWDMYSDVPGGTPPYTYILGNDQNQGGSAGGEGESYNREHSWPKSWFNDASPMNTDLFHIVPTDTYVNSKRENEPYGEVNNPTWTSQNGSRLGPCSYPGYTGTAFEPIDGYKGDFARNYFYMATRYLNEDGGWQGSAMADGAVLEPWAEAMLIEWHLDDPVSTKEIERNEAVYIIQDNRNPFIDHPEFVLMVYDPNSVESGNPQTAITVLHQNVPNPFHGITSIGFTLSETAVISITVYDIHGRLIDTVAASSQFAAGYQELLWDGRTASGEQSAPGIYFFRLSSPDGVLTRSMIMIGD